MSLWKLKRRPRKILLSRYLAKVRWLRIHPPMLSGQACTPRKASHFAPVLWDVGGDGSEGLNIQNTRTSIQFISFPFISPPSMLKLWGFQKGLSGYVHGLSISVCSHSSFLVHWPSWYMMRKSQSSARLSNCVRSFAHGIASEDFFHRPNGMACRHHESETNV